MRRRTRGRAEHGWASGASCGKINAVCWSANADIAAGSAVVALGVFGVAAERRPRSRLIAGLPILLGAHQLIESVVWRGTSGDISPHTAAIARVAWATIALPVLPVFVPLAVIVAAGGRVAPRAWGLLGVGAVVSVVLARSLATSHVTAQPRGHVLDYGVGIPDLTVVVAGYLVATLGSLLVSDDRDIRILGLVLTVGAVICGALWLEEFASTWCAFAACASLLLLRRSWVFAQRPLVIDPSRSHASDRTSSVASGGHAGRC